MEASQTVGARLGKYQGGAAATIAGGIKDHRKCGDDDIPPLTKRFDWDEDDYPERKDTGGDIPGHPPRGLKKQSMWIAGKQSSPTTLGRQSCHVKSTQQHKHQQQQHPQRSQLGLGSCHKTSLSKTMSQVNCQIVVA